MCTPFIIFPVLNSCWYLRKVYDPFGKPESIKQCWLFFKSTQSKFNKTDFKKPQNLLDLYLKLYTMKLS